MLGVTFFKRYADICVCVCFLCKPSMILFRKFSIFLYNFFFFVVRLERWTKLRALRITWYVRLFMIVLTAVRTCHAYEICILRSSKQWHVFFIFSLFSVIFVVKSLWCRIKRIKDLHFSSYHPLHSILKYRLFTHFHGYFIYFVYYLSGQFFELKKKRKKMW